MNTHQPGVSHTDAARATEDPCASPNELDQTYHSTSTLYDEDQAQLQQTEQTLDQIFSQCMHVLSSVEDLLNQPNELQDEDEHENESDDRSQSANANAENEPQDVSRFLLKRAKSEFVAAGLNFKDAESLSSKAAKDSFARCRNNSVPTMLEAPEAPVSLKLLCAEEMFRLGLVPTVISEAQSKATPVVFHPDHESDWSGSSGHQNEEDDGLLRLRVTESQLEELEVDLMEAMAEADGEGSSVYSGSEGDIEVARHEVDHDRGSPRSEVEDNDFPTESVTPPRVGARRVQSPQSLVGEVSAQEWARAVRVNEEILGYDSFSLPIIYEFRRTGFEETVELRLHEKMLIAGRYEVRETIGEAMFSIALRCFDTKEEQEVCVKVIKNDKAYFDQSLDEIKILQYIKAMGDPDAHNVVKLYDFFYHKEHLFIVTELLQEDLYGLYTSSLESGENYFSISRLQIISKHILKALVYIHSLGLIHCDIKPENIMMASKQRCEVKVIDLGSSCFLTDKLTFYIQSRYYRAPEVIVGTRYDQKIDIWSLGCVLAELYTGEVLFQENNAQTLLARMVALCGSFPRNMLVQGAHSAKVFVGKDFTLFERQEDGDVVLIYPRRASLVRRLNHCTDDKFVDFIRSMLVLDPDQRPSADMCLQHAFLRSVPD